MPQEAHDDLRRDAELCLGFLHAGEQAFDGDREWQAAIRVCFGVEEDFRMDAAIGREPREIGEREIAEVLLRLQHVGALIVDVEKILQVRERVGRSHLLHGSERDIDLVLPAEREHQLGLQRAFDMQMQLRLGNAANEGFGYSHGGLRDSDRQSNRVERPKIRSGVRRQESDSCM